MLEIIACSLADALAAERGGADRIELISHFEVGGLTPAFELVREVVQAVKIPVRVMLRATENFEVQDETERKHLCATARALATLPIGGIVCGFLQEDAIDEDLLARVLAAAPQCPVTFHRAIEAVGDLRAAIHVLKKYRQVDCILTSGGTGTASEKIACLDLCARTAAPEMMILAGGGMTPELLAQIKRGTTIRAFHWGTFVREPQTVDGIVKAEKVQEIAQLMNA